jgi:hypothetical protein
MAQCLLMSAQGRGDESWARPGALKPYPCHCARLAGSGHWSGLSPVLSRPQLPRCPPPKVGDPKAGILTTDMVDSYLTKNVLVFDRSMLKSLFAEADFRKEGFLDARALTAALAGKCISAQVRCPGV